MSKDVVQKHIEQVCKDAGLGVMVQVYEIIQDRESVSTRALLGLTAEVVDEHYNMFVGPAIDEIEKTFEPRKMTRIVITIPQGDELEDNSDYVNVVANQVREGYTSGHWDAEHHWTTEEVES